MLDKIADLAAAALPPLDESPRGIRRWRLMVWAIQWFTLSFLGAHIAWACNWLPGVPGFALAADVVGIQSSLQNLTVDLLSKNIFEMRIRQCRAVASGTQQIYTEQLQKLLDQYQSIAGKTYLLPACSEL